MARRDVNQEIFPENGKCWWKGNGVNLRYNKCGLNKVQVNGVLLTQLNEIPKKERKNHRTTDKLTIQSPLWINVNYLKLKSSEDPISYNLLQFLNILCFAED